MREILPMIGWLSPLYLVCVYVSLPNEIKLLLFNIFFFGMRSSMKIILLYLNISADITKLNWFSQPFCQTQHLWPVVHHDRQEQPRNGGQLGQPLFLQPPKDGHPSFH